MQINTRGTKMLLMALKKEVGHTEEWQIKHTSLAPSVDNGMLFFILSYFSLVMSQEIMAVMSSVV